VSAFEKHYSVQQVSEMWGLSEDTIRRLFRDEAGVLKIGSAETRFKRKRWRLSIPESAMLRVHTRLAKQRI
jgi:AraC-like DNA-binding protein